MGVFDNLIERIRQGAGQVREGMGQQMREFLPEYEQLIIPGESPRTIRNGREVPEEGELLSPVPKQPQPVQESTPAAPIAKEKMLAEKPMVGEVQGAKTQKKATGSIQSKDITKKAVMDFYKSQIPEGSNLEDYYPVADHLEEMIEKGEEIRPGLGALMALQSFFESTGGRNTPNLFGVKPGGKSSKFASPQEAIDYQLSQNVLGGGANPNMNIANEGTKEPITVDRIRQLYKSYDPPGAYLDSLLDAFQQVSQVKRS